MLYPLDRARDVLRFYRDFCPTLPDEAEGFAGLLTSPDGVPVAALILGYNGALEEGERVLAPARHFGNPLADLVGPMPYGARQIAARRAQRRCTACTATGAPPSPSASPTT